MATPSLQSRELISSDPLHIPVTFKVKGKRVVGKKKEKKKHFYKNMAIYTTYDTEQTARKCLTFKNKIDSERHNLYVLYHTFLVRFYDKDEYTVLSTTVKTQTFNDH